MRQKHFLVEFLLVAGFIVFSSYICTPAEAPKGYTKAQVAAAKKVMSNAGALADIYEESGHLVVEFREYLFPYDINNRLRTVRAIADADCILHGKPRSIFFYNPDGKLIGKADRINGVRLRD